MVEIIYTWSDGREEVRYRRPEGSEDAEDFRLEIEALRERLGNECPYRIEIR